MKQFLRVLLFFNILFFVACSPTSRLQQTTQDIPSLAAPLERGYKVALYKAKIDLKDNHFSGLFYFKKNDIDSTKRIIFVSEFGLNLLDLEYKNNQFKVISCKDFLNKKIILNTLQKNIKLLIDTPTDEKKKIYLDEENNRIIVKVKEDSERYYYFYSPKKDLEKILTKNKFTKRIAQSYNLEKGIPKKIVIEQSNIGLKFELNLIKTK